MPVQQNSSTHLRVLLVITDRGINTPVTSYYDYDYDYDYENTNNNMDIFSKK